MSLRSVVVVHRSPMVAEGIAAALGRYPWIAPVAAAVEVAEGERRGERADAVALDQYMTGAEGAAARLRRKGVRVVFIGNGDADDDGVRVPPDASIATLASALVPEAAAVRPPVSRLSPREREVLSLVARGLAGKQVARHLGISPKTVELHKSRIFAKLRVPNQTAAVRVALSDGIDLSLNGGSRGAG